MNNTRLASEAGDDFPYEEKTTCWIALSDGNLSYLKSRSEKAAALALATQGLASLYGVWPGKWRSDLFEFDDLAAVGRALGISARA